MVAELGLLALIFALIFSLLLALLPIVGWYGRYSNLLAMAKPMAQGQFVFLLISFLLLVWVFLTDDFSVAYVAQQSNTRLPYYYKISGIWGGHEGSMLLWLLILAGWTLAVAQFSKALPKDLVAVVLAVMGMVTAAFTLFTVFTSSPFERIFPDIPADGRDLNPLLQDIGLILHPPMLYMGYVGFAVAFAFAIAALITGRMDNLWARWARPWTDMAWVFLTLGIGLGSWWAYYELGWGGWWFWDPVENASLIPWLVGTALMHSLAVTEKRSGFKVWTLLLAIFTFAFVLLGTFLVRSGILTSVHAFANDPTRGQLILAILLTTLVASLGLFAWRAPQFREQLSFHPGSRESFLLINNVILVTLGVIVALLTLLPLLWPVLGMGQVSIGAPVFNMVFNPLMALLIFFMGFGQLLQWKKDSLKTVLWPMLIWLPISILLAFALTYLYGRTLNLLVVLSLVLALWILFSSLLSMQKRGVFAADGWQALRRQPPSYYGMLLGHLGVVLVVIGATFVTQYEVKRDVRMGPGTEHELAGYRFVLQDFEVVEASNWVADQANMQVFRGQRFVTELQPQKRDYFIAGQVMTEAGIQSRLHRDLYVSMGEPLTDGDWSFRLQVKPMVPFMWLGTLILCLAGILAVLDRRYRRGDDYE